MRPYARGRSAGGTTSATAAYDAGMYSCWVAPPRNARQNSTATFETNAIARTTTPLVASPSSIVGRRPTRSVIAPPIGDAIHEPNPQQPTIHPAVASEIPRAWVRCSARNTATKLAARLTRVAQNRIQNTGARAVRAGGVAAIMRGAVVYQAPRREQPVRYGTPQRNVVTESGPPEPAIVSMRSSASIHVPSR